MMRSFTTDAIVLKRFNYDEADRVLTVLTLERGMATALAKAVRRQTSKLRAVVEPFMLVRLTLHEGRTWLLLTEGEIKNALPYVHSSLPHTETAYLGAQLLLAALVENQPVSALYHYFAAWLTALDSAPAAKIQILPPALALKILATGGFLPDLNHCAVCGRSIPVGAPLRRATQGIDGHRHGGGAPISKLEAKWFMALLHLSPEKLMRIKIDSGTINSSRATIQAWWEQLTEKPYPQETYGTTKLVRS